jgi:acetylglutamate kinase
VTFELVKIGGSCIAKDVGAVAEALPAGKLLVVHGYGAALRRLLAEAGVERREFVSASGVRSHFTGEAELHASLLAAHAEGQRLAAALAQWGRSARAVLGHRGFFRGERKRALRYLEGGIMRVHRGDRSGRFREVVLETIEKELAQSDVLLLGATLEDAETKEPLVCDADAIAAGVAVSARLSRYTILSDVDGFMVDGVVVAQVSQAGMNELVSKAHGGMSKKLRAIAAALSGGVAEVVLRNGLLPAAPEKGTRFSCA